MPKEVIKILREGQYQMENGRFIVQAPKVFRKTKEQEIDESTQRIDDLREEIKSLENELNEKVDKAEYEAEDIVDKAEQEAQRVVEQAEKSAFDRVQKSLDEKDEIIDDRKHELEDLKQMTQNESDKIIQNATQESQRIKDEARRDGFKMGQAEGFEFAKEEVVHMVKRLHSIISATIQERERILVHSEQQIIKLVTTMVQKIVKELTEEEENMVINNTKAALQLVRGAMKVYIRVNPDDYRYTLQHKDALIAMIEGMPEVKFFEDPTIGKGGVYIETDIGEIDATVAIQLEEIQSQMKHYMPMKVKTVQYHPEDELEEQEPVDSRALEGSSIIPDLDNAPVNEASQETVTQTKDIGDPPKEPEFMKRQPTEVDPGEEDEPTE